MTVLRYGLRFTLAILLLGGFWFLSFLGNIPFVERRVQDSVQYQQAQAKLEGQIKNIAKNTYIQITEYDEFELNPLVRVSFFVTRGNDGAEPVLRVEPALIIPNFLIYALFVAVTIIGLSAIASRKVLPAASERLANASESPWKLLVAECRNFDEEVSRMQREGRALLWTAVLLATVGLCVLIWLSGEHVLGYAKHEIAKDLGPNVATRIGGLEGQDVPAQPSRSGAETSEPLIGVEGHSPSARDQRSGSRLGEVPWGWYVAWVAMQAVAAFFLAVYRISMGRLMDLYQLRNHRVEQLFRWSLRREEDAEYTDLSWVVAAKEPEN